MPLPGPRIGSMPLLLIRPQKRNSSYANKVLSYSPLAYWPLSQSSGVGVEDVSGNNYEAKATGVTWDAGAGPDGGSAAYFDGLNDYILCLVNGAGSANGLSTAFLTAANDEITAITWFKVDSLANWSDGSIDAILQIWGNVGRWYSQKNSVTNRFVSNWQSGGTSTVVNSVSYTDWTSVVVSASKSNGRIRTYLNGALINTATSTFAGGFGTSVVNITIGSLDSTPTSPWHGWLRDIAIIPQELPESDVLNLLVR